MKRFHELLAYNKAWAANIKQKEPDFFTKLAEKQIPKHLWIGCADARVSPELMLDLKQGNMFVHRNIANMAINTDFNYLSVLQYAVEVLKVEHVIVCGHYGCGGVNAALDNNKLGLIDNWLQPIKSTLEVHHQELAALEGTAKINRACELNVIAQVQNVCDSSVIQQAWQDGAKVAVHGWIFDMSSGIVSALFEGATKASPNIAFESSDS